jgi:hypothetical protein
LTCAGIFSRYVGQLFSRLRCKNTTTIFFRGYAANRNFFRGCNANIVVILASIGAVFPISFRGYVASDKPVANFNLAIDQGYGERKTTAWVRVSVFGKQAEAAAQHLSKGDLVSVQSDFFRVAAWTSQDNSPQGQLEVTARRVDFIITKREQVEADNEDQMPF